jgi:hypothetical protein
MRRFFRNPRHALSAGGGDDPTDHDGHVHARVGQLGQHGGNQLGVGAGEDGEADHVHALVDRGAGDAGRR